MSDFSASTQYGDFEGTAAADGSMGISSVEELLHKKNLMTSDERLLAAEIYTSQGFTYAKAYLVDDVDEATKKDPIPVREIDLALTLQEFADLFKRFSVVLTSRHRELKNRDYVVLDS